MPIYAYKCDACGHAKDVLQKMSDPQLTGCPACGQATFKKQLTAAGFQLKGTGWYVTDFREGGGKTSAPATDGSSAAAATPAGASEATSASASSATPAVATSAATSPSSTPSAAPSSTAASSPAPAASV